MVTEQVVKAAGLAAAAGSSPDVPVVDGSKGEMARLGMAAQLYAVKTGCSCPSCQALRKLADLTMTSILEMGVAATAAEELPAPPAPVPVPTEAFADAPGSDSPPD